MALQQENIDCEGNAICNWENEGHDSVPLCGPFWELCYILLNQVKEREVTEVPSRGTK